MHRSWLTTCLPWHTLFGGMEAVRLLRLWRVKACWNWFWVHSSTNMIRVAAHKLGSISSSPQSATVLTILTQPTDLQRLLPSLQLFHWLSNWHLFTWPLIHSILPFPHTHTHTHTHPPKRSIPSTPDCCGRSKAGVHALLSHTCHLLRVWKATGSLWGVKMKSVSVWWGFPSGQGNEESTVC